MDINHYLDEHENKSLLRILTCGSVDDGKSTLIGRLLYDSKLIFDDQLSALRKASEKNGTTGVGQIDYALLLDGLKAEREQGITIDVAYRYFTTPNRKFIIADCPGHEQYTRNMATGASTANLAIILIDARHGILTQTRRHTYIVSLLGIRHLIVAVNKMDLFDYDRHVFNNIKESFQEFAQGLPLPDIRYIPISALEGENVTTKSDKIDWYDGPSLLDILETVDTARDRNYEDFRFPVQYVIRPDLNFRGFAGSIVSGTIRKGDSIVTLPSGKESRIKRIVTADGDLDEAFVPQAVTLELEDEIDISSGEMIVKKDNLPQISHDFEAVVFWMTENPLKEGSRYVLRQAGRNVPAMVQHLTHAIDVNTLERYPVDELGLNQVGRISLGTMNPIFFDIYKDNPATGAFILIDTITNATAGAGMILRNLDADEELTVAKHNPAIDDPLKPLNLSPGLVSRSERVRKRGHDGKSLLISGNDPKQVKAWSERLEQSLFARNFQTYFLSLPTDSEISEQILQRLVALSFTLAEAGIISVTPLPYFPAAGEISYWPPVKSEKLPLMVWLGEASTAPPATHLIISPTGDPETKIEILADLLTDTTITATHI